MPELSLTQQEAAQRAALLTVQRYDIEVDLRGLLDGERWAATSTVTFSCAEPGATTFVDCVATVLAASLNGQPLDVATVVDGRLPLTGLQADNVLVVESEQLDTTSAAGILRTVDPVDGLVYVWTSFEADDARRAWACFDQPDLKAPHGFTVLAPASWTVTSNSAPDVVEDGPGAARTWRFADTPSLSTYVVVVNAGPFVEIREERGGHSLGLYARQSLRAYLERDAQELLGLTETGLAFFGEQFGQPFPQHRYDQVFVPDMGGAMENWGSVTWTDAALHRSEPTRQDRSWVANVLLHEMAHMWFGDLVTMRWWDDLWLNEAFASWAALWAQVRTTDYTEAVASELLASQPSAYAADMGPASHPIRGEVPDVAQAMANFDAITYEKGCTVLGQLVAHVGEDAFVEGLRSYFRDHAWGNTRLGDLMDAVGAAAGTDLTGWTAAWFDRAGTDTLTLVTGPGGAELHAVAPHGSPRPHTVEIGSYRDPYRDSGEGPLELVATTRVTTTGDRTPVADLPTADLHLVDAGAATFAAVRTEGATEQLLASAGRLPDPTARAVALSAVWDMLVKGEVSSGEVLDCFLDALAREDEPLVVEPLLDLATRVATSWTPSDQVAAQQARVAERATEVARVPDLRAPALRTLADTGTADQLGPVTDAVADDLELHWRLLTRRASLGEHDEAAVTALAALDPDPDAGVRAAIVRVAQPDAEAKATGWQLAAVERGIPAGGLLGDFRRAFWRPEQADLVLPYCQAYLDLVTSLPPGAMLNVLGLIGALYPDVADQTFVDHARTAAADPATTPTVRSQLHTATDLLVRRLRARDVAIS
ncbi:aminopeptidase N [Nocardioides rubriscoriae]|uniref:aminopeptidase N n=1 Tax=Nocardioides rubriscoriae TaxID=642762 RepID=UPI0011E067AC|nr:aminopeptidase N [Nocardioides rubriscoriae]